VGTPQKRGCFFFAKKHVFLTFFWSFSPLFSIGEKGQKSCFFGVFWGLFLVKKSCFFGFLKNFYFFLRPDLLCAGFFKKGVEKTQREGHFLHFFTPEKQGGYVLLLGRNGKFVPIFVPINLAIFRVFWGRVLGVGGFGGQKGGYFGPPQIPPLGAPLAAVPTPRIARPDLVTILGGNPIP
jgi:hypothetical protein